MLPNPAADQGDAAAGNWEEQGQGTLTLMQGTNGRTRMIMKSESTTRRAGAVLLNQLVQPLSSLIEAASEDGSENRAFTFEAEDFATGASPDTVDARGRGRSSPKPPHPHPPYPHPSPPRKGHCRVWGGGRAWGPLGGALGAHPSHTPGLPGQRNHPSWCLKGNAGPLFQYIY